MHVELNLLFILQEHDESRTGKGIWNIKYDKLDATIALD